jgi:peptidoglycan/LPS O-acetylase OafA/YrhL
VNKTRHFPSLNGWRAVAILLVLGRHFVFVGGMPSGLAGFFTQFDGELGVRLFFTLSGFLITWLMLNEERQAGRISLSRFYARRAARILPVYLACLLVLAALQFWGSYPQPGRIWLQLLTFTRNFYQTGHSEFFASAHFWSLSVEEQFYFMWPLGFLCLRGAPARRLKFLGAVVVLSTAWKIIALLGCYNRHLYFLFQGESTFIEMDGLALGCIGAIWLDQREDGLRKFFVRYGPAVFLLAAMVLIVPEIAGLGRTVQPMAFLLLLLHSIVVPEFAAYRLLNQRWLVTIGILSYSLYIWQQLVLVLWPAPAWWFLAMPATFVAAGLSYWFLERPFFGLRNRLRNARMDTNS